MNIFVLDLDPKKCAQYHCDKHLVKMITEHNQILGSISHILRGIKKKSDITLDYKKENFQNFPRVDNNQDPHPYGIGYKSHPCTQWAMSSLENYNWLCNLNLEMCKEYTLRYGKKNVGEDITLWYQKNAPVLKSSKLTSFALAMPEELKSNDTVDSYRLYYASHKAYFAKWKNGEPEWWKKYLEIAVEKNLVSDRSIKIVKDILNNNGIK